ncbi:hypothetical protein [Caldimonas tepidiphila]|uniref:hypothetical protein n=1 Tax=Caldimonas tepidiphila TaxID=2315841 RepID=UPI003AF34103
MLRSRQTREAFSPMGSLQARSSYSLGRWWKSAMCRATRPRSASRSRRQPRSRTSAAGCPGEVSRREGQEFGFLRTVQGEHVFIPPALLTKLPSSPSNEAIGCIASMSRDKQGKAGWRALSWA